MNRLIQLIQLIFIGKFLNARQHYGNEKMVQFYQEFNDQGLFNDEREIIDGIKVSGRITNSLLMVGAGRGRECIGLLNYFDELVAFEPVEAMLQGTQQSEKILWIDDLRSLQNRVFDVIWLTKFLPSLLTRDERRILYSNLSRFISSGTSIIVKPDIMKLTWKETFRFQLASLIIKYRILHKQWEIGDTVRQNLDFNTAASGLVYYHYFQSEEDFLNDFKKSFNERSMEISKCPLGFIEIKFF